MQNIKLFFDHVECDPPVKPLLITGSRIGGLLAPNKYNSPFKVWANCTRTYMPPIEDSIYTIAGKTIEPKQADWLDTKFDGLIRPIDIYGGPDPSANAYYNFFNSSNKPFGGMWDYLLPDCVIECKTTSEKKKWNGVIPEGYALQAALYARLKGIDHCKMCVTYLPKEAYDDPSQFIVNDNNTETYDFNVSERYPYFDWALKGVEYWYSKYVLTGVSPVWSNDDLTGPTNYLDPIVETIKNSKD